MSDRSIEIWLVAIIYLISGITELSYTIFILKDYDREKFPEKFGLIFMYDLALL
ncbi:hypothetical protein [Scytonema sp. NUACC26]|uniref:hypothetical protein n=1 Tax=Scytonema sp. NUACC26 TaxID=3140176 RepID=UPI0034DCB375